MMEINFKQELYLYGKVTRVREKAEDNFQKDFLIIYTHPMTFKAVPLSSLEGYFICNEDNGKLHWSDKVRAMIPQISIRRDNMKNFEKKHNGKFWNRER